MIRDLLAQGVAAGEFQVADVELTSRFVQAIGMEAVRRIHDDPESQPEEATVAGHTPADHGRERRGARPQKKTKKKPKKK